jgi:hypothetical protein
MQRSSKVNEVDSLRLDAARQAYQNGPPIAVMDGVRRSRRLFPGQAANAGRSIPAEDIKKEHQSSLILS